LSDALENGQTIEEIESLCVKTAGTSMKVDIYCRSYTLNVRRGVVRIKMLGQSVVVSFPEKSENTIDIGCERGVYYIQRLG